MILSKLILPILLVLSAVSFQGCGIYSFTGAGIPGVEKVHIPLFTNATIEFGLEEQLTEAINLAVNNDSRLNIAERSEADAVMEGRLTRIVDMPHTYDKMEEVSEYKVEIYAHVLFENLKTRKAIFDEDFSGWGLYSGESGGIEERQEAIDKAIEKLAEDIINRTLSGW